MSFLLNILSVITDESTPETPDVPITPDPDDPQTEIDCLTIIAGEPGVSVKLTQVGLPVVARFTIQNINTRLDCIYNRYRNCIS